MEAETATSGDETTDVVVVGAGLAGLAATLHLLGAGRGVTLLERDSSPGGRVSDRLVNGYRIDMGASVFTMPELLDEAFAAVGCSVSEWLTLMPLHPAYLAQFADGSTIAVHTDPEAMESEIRAVAGPADAEGYRRLRSWLSELYAVQRDRFIGANFDSVLDLATPALARLAALGGFGRLGAKVARFVTDERLRRLFTFQSLYAGLEPMRALAAYGVIAYMDTVAGVHYPQGGMGEVARAMTAAASAAGATVRLGTSAEHLERDSGGCVRAVRTSTGERIRCGAVVLATELTTAYALLGRAPRRPVRLRYSPSAVVLYGHARADGADSTALTLGHHTLSFGSAWRDTFAEIVRKGSLMSDPSLLVTRPTATDPTLAPQGQDVITVLAPAPNLHISEVDWPRITGAYRDELLRTLDARGFHGLAGNLVVESVATPRSWESEGLGAGTPFSLAHTLAQTGPFRPANRVRGADNVVLAGCGTTPGVGIPPVLVSGKLAAERLLRRQGACAVED
ncbi:phytoene desaturase family protein [Saccharomonospora xinjiangensis]|uniref:Phytoene desaturase n=1 Tax=Saccharomonospora xinjiangensis XJ-54 TaxID=882086 RepID=I0V659_9PSEU|nr:phytoene desaturase family protein [Saccharomonospora xinjiangensis]EID55612.1 phytoene desaturase [Saccharomonospora xinjiangensis XJ-54]